MNLEKLTIPKSEFIGQKEITKGVSKSYTYLGYHQIIPGQNKLSITNSTQKPECIVDIDVKRVIHNCRETYFSFIFLETKTLE